MAIKVNARAIKQDTADASVFGYNTVYQSAAPAVAGALSQAASSISQASAKLKARQEANDREIAYANYSSYKTALEGATNQLNDAYASGGKEFIDAAEENFRLYDASSPEFSLATFGEQDVTNPDSYARFHTDAKALYQKVDFAERHRKQHYISASLVKKQNQAVEDFVFKVTNDNTGKPIPTSQLEQTFTVINDAYSSNIIDALASEQAKTAARGDLSDKLVFAFESAVAGAGFDTERIEDIRDKFVELRSQGQFDGFGKSEELIKYANKAISSVTDEQREQYLDQLKVEVDNKASRFFNGLSQAAITGTEAADAVAFLRETNHIDLNLFEEGSKEYKELSSARDAAMFFVPSEGGNISPYHLTISNALKTGDVEIPKEYEGLLARTRGFTNVRDRIKRAVKTVKDGLALGDTSVLEKLGHTTYIDKKKFLNNHGYPFTPIVVPTKVEFNIEDRAKLKDYASDTLRLNGEGQGGQVALLQHAHNLKTGTYGNDRKLEGFFLEHVAMSGGANVDETVSLFSKFWNEGNPTAISSLTNFEDIVDVVVTEESELKQLRTLARKTGNDDVVGFYDRIIDGMVRDVMDQQRIDPSAFLAAFGANKKRLRKGFYEREDKLVANNIGIARQTAVGHSVRIPQQIMDRVNLQAKYPFAILDTPLRTIRNSDAYQRLTIPPTAVMNKGMYEVLPQMFTERYVEAISDEMVDTFDFVFREDAQLDALTAMGGDLAELAEDFRAGRVQKEDLADTMREAVYVDRSGAQIPYLDFSTFGNSQDGSGKIGIAVRVYNPDTVSYEPLISKDNKQVVIPVSSIARRFDAEGIIFKSNFYDLGETGTQQALQLGATSTF
jgi:hypothetical protein